MRDRGAEMNRIIFAICNQSEPARGPHFDICDLRIEYRIDMGYGMYGIVSDKVADTIGMKEGDLKKEALSNLKPYITTFGEILGMPPQEDEIIVVTNEDQVNGFTALLYPGLLEELKDKYGDYHIIPSSKHEALIVPEKLEIDVNALKTMVRAINLSSVDEKDRLSDNIYKYDGEKIVIA